MSTQNEIKLNHVDTKEFIGSEHHIAGNGYIYDFEYQDKDYRVFFVTDYINYNVLHRDLMELFDQHGNEYSTDQLTEIVKGAIWDDGEILIETTDDDGYDIDVEGELYNELCELLSGQYQADKELQFEFEVEHCVHYMNSLHEDSEYAGECEDE